MDCSVGTIVWVRRRNGSWWPGRILGPEELSASHLMSPRSGTPVKLLGREDASVDWYNLEKSKRVKAFRCGEFDACIEKAEASQGIPIKKREKYARREDAILHALELEKQQLEIKHQKLGTSSNVMNNKTLGARRRELNSFPAENYMGDDEPGAHSKFANHKSQILSVKAASLHEEEDNLYVHNRTKVKQVGRTEHNPEAVPRMRGLQDFGLRIAPPKKKFSQATWETSCKPASNHASLHSNSGHMIENVSYGDGSKSSMTIKRKRSHGGPSEESLVKKRDRRRPLVRVLESSAKLPVSHSFQSGYDSGDISVQGEMDHMGASSQAKRSNCVYLPADSNDSLDNDGYPSEQMPFSATQFCTSDYLDQAGALTEEYTSSTVAEETEPDTSGSDSSESETDENGLADSTQILLPGSRNCDPPAVHISENFEGLNDDEKPHPGYMPMFLRQDQLNASADGVSKWHMKGKRNIRQIPKRPMDPMDGKGTSFEGRASSFKMRTEPPRQRVVGRSSYHKEEASPYAFHGGDMLERQRHPFASQAARDRGRSQNSFNDSDSDSHLLSPSHWEADMRRVYWDDADDCYNLIDVELKVQAATYQGEHVPLVSLMSRLNGKAIIGHPVQIEILEDGSAAQLVSKYEADLDEYAAPSAVWKTARRSVMHRVPRSNPVSALEGEDADPIQDSDPAYAGYFNHQAKLAKKSISHARRPSVPGKSQKKHLKKPSLSSQKTRTLSSFATEQRRSDLLEGLIKPDGSAPLVTCVPVKVAFSRILEAVGRPSSCSAHRARMAIPAVVTS
ncbi:uncharacterized protein M6B38_327075 [Iris pallida]|uniref:PWWP domain-containing protein n=1 Tax=Iris pallida TaxID=29817 RepID=A0AAX6H6G0_IRIPA|nr:uncharacterized protein M6B38_327075 [Iris pallida]